MRRERSIVINLSSYNRNGCNENFEHLFQGVGSGVCNWAGWWHGWVERWCRYGEIGGVGMGGFINISVNV